MKVYSCSFLGNLIIFLLRHSCSTLSCRLQMWVDEVEVCLKNFLRWIIISSACSPLRWTMRRVIAFCVVETFSRKAPTMSQTLLSWDFPPAVWKCHEHPRRKALDRFVLWVAAAKGKQLRFKVVGACMFAVFLCATKIGSKSDFLAFSSVIRQRHEAKKNKQKMNLKSERVDLGRCLHFVVVALDVCLSKQRNVKVCNRMQCNAFPPSLACFSTTPLLTCDGELIRKRNDSNQRRPSEGNGAQFPSSVFVRVIC